MKIYPIFRSLLFKLDPELAHQLTLNLLRLGGDFAPINTILRRIYRVPSFPVQAFGLNFSNPIGLAAGYDKDGLGWHGLACLGFGHIEIGTVTPKQQAGNPKPRIFRLPEERALINRMGFPGSGAEFVKKQLIKKKPKNLILGVNIGKNKDTPLDTADKDYVYLLKLFAQHVDYVTINISSPNTVGLRRLQERHALDQLLNKLYSVREQLKPSISHPLPILVKLSPDLSDSELDDALEVILTNQIDGVVATNTTLKRGGVDSIYANVSGGLSGKPLQTLSLEMVSKITKRTNGRLPVIGVGGISDANGVQRMLDAGAVLVQIYTGLIYEGPGLIKQILSELYH